MRDIDKAIEVIGNRRSDGKLAKRAMRILGYDLPVWVTSESVSVCIAPHVAGGTNAELDFAREVIGSEGNPIWASYIEDKFTTRNPAKVNHWRPKIAWPKGQVTRQWVVPEEIRTNPNTGIGTASTMFEMGGDRISVADYQGRLQKFALEASGVALQLSVVDYSSWYSRQCARRSAERSAEGYYPAIMALYSVFGVMFRYDRPDNQDSEDFRSRVADPAFRYAKDELGVEPVIISRDYPEDGAVTDLSGHPNVDALAPMVLPAARMGVKDERI